MKNKLLYLMVLTSVFLTSCKKDVEDRLPGDWNLNSAVEVKIPNSQTTEKSSENGTITFNEDGSGTAKIDGKTESFSWTSSNEKVTMTVDGLSYVYSVITNEKKKQVWEYNDKIVEDDDGEKIEINLKETLTLTK